MTTPYGLLVVDKPEGWTSHDVVARTRKVLNTRKVGHSGTLDPPATGVLVLGIGRATRLLRFVTALPKTYVGEIVFGTETTTLDDTGEVTATHEMSVSLDEARAATDALTGDIEQIPPMVSAVKVDGKRLHELARAGEEVERAARPVTVWRYDLEATDDAHVLRCHVECSSGTYVRTLAADLGHLLGGGAHLRRLRRTAVGPFTIERARPVDEPEVVAPVEIFASGDVVAVTGDLETAVGHGKVLERSDLGVDGDGPWPVVDEAGDLVAVYQAHRGTTAKPSIVLRG